MNKYAVLILMGVVVVCATVLGALHVLPSEAVTAILGGAIVQGAQLVRASKIPPSVGAALPVLGMLGGSVAGLL